MVEVEENDMEHSVETPAKQRREKGFTLVETAIALVVMMIGGLGICAVFAYAIKNNTGSRDRAVAIAVAQQEMERYRQVTFLDPLLTAKAATSTTVTSADRTFTVTTQITDTNTSFKTITIDVTPQLSSDPWAMGTVRVSVQRSAFALGPYSGGL
jgi:Tfp pilus assembly protein PilV